MYNVKYALKPKYIYTSYDTHYLKDYFGERDTVDPERYEGFDVEYKSIFKKMKEKRELRKSFEEYLRTEYDLPVPMRFYRKIVDRIMKKEGRN